MCHRQGTARRKQAALSAYDIVIVGAGTAGLSAAIYGVRAGKRVLLLESRSYGGQITNAAEIDNYPGIKHISGFDFAVSLYEQATQLGADYRNEKVLCIENMSLWKRVSTNRHTYDCRCIILATGAKKRPLGLENEQRLTGSGISYCSACDGAFFKEKIVAVVGGGNTALADASALSEGCKQVYLIHRRDAFRGEKALQEAVLQRPNITPVLNSQVIALKGNERLESVELEQLQTKEKTELTLNGLFVAVGQMPENEIFADVVTLDDAGYIKAREDCKTKTDGIFAAGDCRTKHVRQLATAAADGAVAALGACTYIDTSFV